MADFNFDETVTRLMKLADEIGSSETSLDDLVHDLASSEASRVNNEGTEAQIKYILIRQGPEGIKNIEEALNG